MKRLGVKCVGHRTIIVSAVCGYGDYQVIPNGNTFLKTSLNTIVISFSENILNPLDFFYLTFFHMLFSDLSLLFCFTIVRNEAENVVFL